MRASANSRLGRAVSVAFCLLAMLMLSASSIPLRTEVLNDSGRDARISFKGDQYSISSIEIKVGQKVEIAGLLERSFAIQVGGVSNRYHGQLVPEAFVDYRGWGSFSSARYEYALRTMDA